MGLLQNLISRNKPKTAREDVLDDDFNPLNLASTPFISRPPPLDAKTEQELRKACAIILSDLKPSGYDVEDTRMRSDMLLDEAEREGSHYSQASSTTHRSTQAQAVSQAKSTRFSNPNQVGLPAVTTQLASIQRPLNHLKDTRESVRLSTNTKAQIASLMAPLEGPLAPASTAAPVSRQDISRHNISSPLALSTNPAGSSPALSTTTPSANAPDVLKSPSLPSSKHKLISLQEAQAIRAQEAQQAIVAQTVTTHRREESLAPKSPSALQPRGFLRTESLTSQSSRPDFGHSASASRTANERPAPPKHIDSSSSIKASIPPVPPLSAARAAARPDVGRLEGDASAKVMEQKLSSGDIKDKSDELGASGRTRTLPSAPNAEAYIKSLQQNGARTASLTGQRAASLTSHTKQPSHGILKNQPEGGAVVQDIPRNVAGRGGASGAPSPSLAGPALREGASGLPRRAGDPEPGDFDSLMSFMRKESQKNPMAIAVAGSSAHTASHSTSTVTKASGHSHVQSPSRASISSTLSKRGPAIPARTSSRTSSMVNTPFPAGISQQSQSTAAALGSRSNTLRNQQHPLEQHQIQPTLLRAGQNANSSPPKSPLAATGRTADSSASSTDDADDDASPASPATQQMQHTVDIVYHSPPDMASRQSQSGHGGPGFMPGSGGGESSQSVTSGKDRRGLKKIFWRLGGGDMPVRKKIYVPPAPSYGTYAGHPEYDENYWSDEESCAAPVVAFGRGW